MIRHINSQPWMGLRVLGVFDDRSESLFADERDLLW